jgi:hypothetical protein
VTKLEDRLALRRIARVYSIDDEHAAAPRIGTVEQLAEAIHRVTQKVLKQALRRVPALEEFRKRRAAEGYSELDGETQKAELRVLGERLYAEQKLSGDDLVAFAAFIGETKPRETAEKLSKVFGERLNVLSFERWVKDHQSIVDSANDNERILLLLDEKNDEEQHVGIDGEGILTQLWRTHSDRLAFIDTIVITSNCTRDNEFQEAQNLLESVRENVPDDVKPHVSRAFVLSKERLTREPLDAEFVIHLDRLAATQLRGELAEMTATILKQAVDESIKWLEQIPLSEFQGSIFISSQNEGAAEIETLLRLAQLRQRIQIEETLLRDGALIAKVRDLRRFSLEHLDTPYRVAAQHALRDLREQEFARPGPQLNSFLPAISCGDVFRIVDAKGERHAVLLANPCDLMLRLSGKRKLSRGWLVEVIKGPLEQVERHIVEKESGAGAPLVYVLKTGDQADAVTYLFRNSTVDAIDLTVLDLCWTNTSGQAALLPDQLPAAYDFVLPAQKARMKILLQASPGCFPLVEVLGSILQPTVTPVAPYQVDGVDVNEQPSYNVERVWRLAPEFAAAILSSLAQSISRPAFGHDYLRGAS